MIQMRCSHTHTHTHRWLLLYTNGGLLSHGSFLCTQDFIYLHTDQSKIHSNLSTSSSCFCISAGFAYIGQDVATRDMLVLSVAFLSKRYTILR